MDIDTEFETETDSSTYCFTYIYLVKNFRQIKKILYESSIDLIHLYGHSAAPIVQGHIY